MKRFQQQIGRREVNRSGRWWVGAAVFLATAGPGWAQLAAVPEVEAPVAEVAPPVRTPAPVSVELHGSGPVIDDTAFRGRVDQYLNELIASENFVSNEVLFAQLDRRQTALALAASEAVPARYAAADLYERIAAATVVIGGVYQCDRCPNWHQHVATGFFVTADGVVATNHHVLNKPEVKTFAVTTLDGRVLPVQEVLAASREHDVALVRVAAGNYPTLPLARGARVGEVAHIVAHPGRRYFTYTQGVVSRRFKAPASASSVPQIAVTTEFGGGSSGGAIVSDRGDVIGLVTSTVAIQAPVGGNRAVRQRGEEGAENPALNNRYTQMVERRCVPVEAIFALLTEAAPAVAEDAHEPRQPVAASSAALGEALP